MARVPGASGRELAHPPISLSVQQGNDGHACWGRHCHGFINPEGASAPPPPGVARSEEALLALPGLRGLC